MESRERPADWGTARLSAGLSRRVFINRLAGLVTVTVLGASCGAVAGAP